MNFQSVDWNKKSEKILRKTEKLWVVRNDAKEKRKYSFRIFNAKISYIWIHSLRITFFSDNLEVLEKELNFKLKKKKKKRNGKISRSRKGENIRVFYNFMKIYAFLIRESRKERKVGKKRNQRQTVSVQRPAFCFTRSWSGRLRNNNRCLNPWSEITEAHQSCRWNIITIEEIPPFPFFSDINVSRVPSQFVRARRAS